LANSRPHALPPTILTKSARIISPNFLRKVAAIADKAKKDPVIPG
jgi:hypothetical protein